MFFEWLEIKKHILDVLKFYLGYTNSVKIFEDKQYLRRGVEFIIEANCFSKVIRDFGICVQGKDSQSETKTKVNHLNNDNS